MNFIKKLYTAVKAETQSLNQAEETFLNQTGIPKLTNEERNTCEGPLNTTDCLKALRSMQNNKSPGIDGLPCEFYKFFWKDISKIVSDSLNFAFENGELSIDQRRGLITLIPKKDKDRAFLKNW